eukprot:CAMPEP_0181100578 /NCGR_PEP_ID=MMETSP1071-20121207/13268_1 /TAXON_ID=35127 /ORGANISM="Thalassiosira sp., Strain NH16" /LENGTH=302 /DNA_ID=CAMNT_0023183317 /DNA_START=114 /DNA_END=1022 /DNA_ORIENTATION=+
MDAATPLIKSTAGIMEQTSPSYQNSTAITNGDDDRDKIVHEAKSCPWCKILTGVVLLSIIIFVIVDAFTNKYVTSAFRTFLEWVESNLIAGVFAFVGVYFVATVLFVPGSILTLGSGFVFGKAVGLGPGVALATAAVFVGASLGAIAAFLLGRYLLRDWVTRKLVDKYPIIEALDGAFQQEGFRIFVLLRLSPIVPFNAINYIGGVTSTGLLQYALALLFILPGTVVYCSIGATAGSLSESENAAGGPATIATIVVGIVFGLLAVFAMSYYAKKEFNRIVAEQEQEQVVLQPTSGVDEGSEV